MYEVKEERGENGWEGERQEILREERSERGEGRMGGREKGKRY